MRISVGTRAVVTGGGSGLGRALCHQLAGAGAAVGIADLDRDRALATLAQISRAGHTNSPGHFAVFCDVGREDGFDELRTEVERNWSGLDILINNAGIGAAGRLEETSPEDWRLMIDVNLLGAVRGCRIFLPALCRQGSGHIVNIASFAGIACAPGMVTYNVTKAGVIALSESLRGELAASGVGVSVACPAFFASRLLDRFAGPAAVAERVSRMMQRSEVQADDVARDIVNAIEQGRFMVITHKKARRAWLVKRLMPERFFRTVRKQTANWSRGRRVKFDG